MRIFPISCTTFAPVKTLCYILSISLLIIVGMPCADTNSPSDHTDAGEQQGHPAPEGDFCSPLCPCVCMGCHSFSVNIPPFGYSLSTPDYLPVPIPAYSVFRKQDYLQPVWQPPQFA